MRQTIDSVWCIPVHCVARFLRYVFLSGKKVITFFNRCDLRYLFLISLQLWFTRSQSYEIMGRRSQKNFFRPFGPQFGLKIRGGGPPGPLPWIRHCSDHSPFLSPLLLLSWQWSDCSPETPFSRNLPQLFEGSLELQCIALTIPPCH